MMDDGEGSLSSAQPRLACNVSSPSGSEVNCFVCVRKDWVCLISGFSCPVGYVVRDFHLSGCGKQSPVFACHVSGCTMLPNA